MDIGVLGYIGTVEHKEHPPEVWSVPLVTPCIAVFDIPGCKDMLSQVTDKLDVRHDGRSIELNHFDITSYLSAPKPHQYLNKRVRTVYLIFTDLSDMGWQKKLTAFYNLAIYRKDKIAEIPDPEKRANT